VSTSLLVRSFHFISCHYVIDLVSYHVIKCHIMSYHAPSCHIMCHWTFRTSFHLSWEGGVGVAKHIFLGHRRQLRCQAEGKNIDVNINISHMLNVLVTSLMDLFPTLGCTLVACWSFGSAFPRTEGAFPYGSYYILCVFLGVCAYCSGIKMTLLFLPWKTVHSACPEQN
jgi:hypothetical protein